ncbi:hypothetical protein SAMN06295967_11492 [Belliella buryatensis]|uniref:Uncharacterized protein n=1 Tax=Belliella buryatensis TaxID=1500549 RepID=A0A239G467_9BACT|nr:hypothetical protein [Belliella buryatensis]SNS63412.1 hypothetical protein SAMN06295967_11492 [Belliella buryatensis]
MKSNYDIFFKIFEVENLKYVDPKEELLILDENFNQLGTYQHDGSGILYTFYKDRTFYFNKDIRKFNLDVGNEDTLYLNGIKY